ncbi:MAG: GNAT family N-acetyltransferase [Candidatus Hydrogenedentes bacterium]|nr:GNAT family N-acetyltransferase [Candidatus Hydrogenedentota bacterium]
MHSSKRRKIKTRRWTEADIAEITQCQYAAYSDFPQFRLCDERLFGMQLAAFPEGQFLAEIDGKIVGFCASLIVTLDDEAPWHSYAEMTGSGTFNTHDPSGDTLYGAEIAVHPDYRGQGVAGALYVERKKLMKRFNLRRMAAGGRIPGYARHAGKLTAEQYVDKVLAGELKDQALNAHLKGGYKVRGIHYDYLSDEASLNYATHLEMLNPDFKAERRQIAASPITRPVRRVRVCAAQYNLRGISSWDEFERQVDFFVTTAEQYHCHFLMFPELFTAQLISTMDPNLEPLEAIRKLSEYTDRYIEMYSAMSKRFGGYIIAGTHPVARDGQLYNVAHLFSPTGRVYTQDKLHITPAERELWGIQPGSGLAVFETEFARIAIQVCYDIEFPEMSRLLTLHGAEVVFVPFMTDEKKAYFRVRYCAQARAVENYIYTVIAGSVGNLPQVRSFLINYSQAAVFTPSDFAFPPHATAAEAEANTEMVVITDLDLGTLAMQRDVGTVRPLRDRRPDLYSLTPTKPVDVIRTQ